MKKLFNILLILLFTVGSFAQSKVYTKGGVFYIVDTQTNRQYEGIARDVLVKRSLTSSDDFYFANVNGWGDAQFLNITDIQDESGTPYVLADFVAFTETLGTIPVTTASNSTITSTFVLDVSKGKVPGHSVVDKFGENPDVDTGSSEDIWEFGGLYIYDTDGTAPIQYLSSDNVSDTEPIKVTGLDINGDEVEQTITLIGQTNISLTTPLWRVYRLENEGVNDIVGTVYCHTDPTPTLGVPLANSVRAIVTNGNNQSLMALYTIPKGYIGFLYRGELGASRSVSAGEAQTAYYSRRLGKVFKIKKRINISNSGSSIYQDARSFPDIIPSFTDIKLSVESVSNNNSGLFGTFDILLIEETLFPVSFLQAIGQPGY